MALLFECMGKCCRNMLDTADIVRDAWGSVVATCLTPPTLSETPVLPTIFNTCWYSVGVSCALAACVTTAMTVVHRRMPNIVVLFIALIAPPYLQKFVVAFTVRLPSDHRSRSQSPLLSKDPLCRHL